MTKLNILKEMIPFISLAATIVIGVCQICIARRQSKINKELLEIQTNLNVSQSYISQSKGIIGNKNNGDISNNQF